jgi:hypothetical protein
MHWTGESSKIAGPVFDLLMSTYITGAGRGPSRSRFERLEVFNWSMTSYANLKSLRRAYLFIELGPDYQARQEDVQMRLKSLFGDRLAVLQFHRVAKQSEWKTLFAKYFSTFSNDDLIWFFQNDDHPFIDIDETVWIEGLQQMQKDPSQFKSMYPSHWPEVLKLAGKTRERVEMCGAYMRTTMTMMDSVLLSNFAWVKKMLIEIPWDKDYKRVDMLMRDKRLGGAAARRVGFSYQTLYIPLREICHKFDGYQIQGIPPNEVPWLVLPPKANIFNRSRGPLTTLMTAVKGNRDAFWGSGNPFKIPQMVIDRAIALYANKKFETRCLLIERLDLVD